MLHKPKVPNSQTRSMSHGRGGAGNMGSGSNDVETKDLQTPTLKSEHYTTGRGGTQHPTLRGQARYDL